MSDSDRKVEIGGTVIGVAVEKATKSSVALVAKLSKKGIKVWANFRGKGLWYPGSISRVHKDGMFNVDYDDGEEEAFVDATNLQLATAVAPAAGHVYKEGYTVNTNYFDRGTFQQARICFAHTDGTYDVIYSNGLTEYRKAESSLFVAYTSLTWKWNGTYDVVYLDGRCVKGYPKEGVIRKSSTDYQILIMVMVLIAIVILIIVQVAKILHMMDEL